VSRIEHLVFKRKIMRNFISLIIRRCRLAPIVLVCAHTAAWAQSAPDNLATEKSPINITSPVSQALTAAEQDAILKALLANKTVAAQPPGHKVRAVRIKHGFVTTRPNSTKQGEYRAIVVMYDYTAGSATEYGLDPDTSAVVSQETLRGRPQASAEEIDIAAKIVRNDPVHARLLVNAAPLAGGFVVDAPPGKPAWHRYLQMKIFRLDLARTLRTVVVDLTDDTIASSN
jgi:hypothetical protein